MDGRMDGWMMDRETFAHEESRELKLPSHWTGALYLCCQAAFRTVRYTKLTQRPLTDVGPSGSAHDELGVRDQLLMD